MYLSSLPYVLRILLFFLFSFIFLPINRGYYELEWEVKNRPELEKSITEAKVRLDCSDIKEEKEEEEEMMTMIMMMKLMLMMIPPTS